LSLTPVLSILLLAGCATTGPISRGGRCIDEHGRGGRRLQGCRLLAGDYEIARDFFIIALDRSATFYVRAARNLEKARERKRTGRLAAYSLIS
jgi:hypothetical protein